MWEDFLEVLRQELKSLGVSVSIIEPSFFMAKSLKMALMNEDGDFVEIGDCSGIGENKSRELFELTKTFKVGEDNTTVFVQSVVIATIEYIQTYPDTKNARAFSIYYEPQN